MENKLENRIADLETWPRNRLIRGWVAIYKQPLPKHIRKDLLIRSLAWKMQEQVFGGLSESCRRKLDDLIRIHKRDPDRIFVIPSGLSPGARLIRSWKNQNHEVLVTVSGFEYKGRLYSNLTQISRLITGINYGGPLFFGLRRKRTYEGKK